MKRRDRPGAEPRAGIHGYGLRLFLPLLLVTVIVLVRVAIAIDHIITGRAAAVVMAMVLVLVAIPALWLDTYELVLEHDRDRGLVVITRRWPLRTSRIALDASAIDRWYYLDSVGVLVVRGRARRPLRFMLHTAKSRPSLAASVDRALRWFASEFPALRDSENEPRASRRAKRFMILIVVCSVLPLGAVIAWLMIRLGA